jgi:hypothetical protein
MTRSRIPYLAALCALTLACSTADEASSVAERGSLPVTPPPPAPQQASAAAATPNAEEASPPEVSPAQEHNPSPEAEDPVKASPEAASEAPLSWADLENPAMVVRSKPSKKSDRVGTVRRGRTFPVYEYTEGRGCKKAWARIGPGWVCSDRFVEAEGPTGPSAPLPFKYGVVYEDTEIHRGPSKRMATGKIRKRKSTVTVLEETKRWVRTWPDQWLQRRVVGPREVRTSSLEGEHITEDTPMPLAFIRRNHTYAYPEPGMKKRERR